MKNTLIPLSRSLLSPTKVAVSSPPEPLACLWGKGARSVAGVRVVHRFRLLRWSLLFLLVLGFSRMGQAQQKGKIARPVDSTRSFESSTFAADYDRVWQLLFKTLSDYGFEFMIKDRNLGRFETNYIIFSRNPRFSRLSNGVKSLAKTPRIFLRKWLDGRIKLFAEVHRLNQNSTKVVLRPDIYGFASTLTDDSGVTGEWRQCVSNGRFEFELFNELATALRKEGSMNPPEVTEVPERPKAVTSEAPPAEGKGSSTLVLNSVPEGAEILLDDQLVGMTPSRLTVPSGSHKVVFRKKGYKDYRREFVILKDSDLTILAELEEP